MSQSHSTSRTRPRSWLLAVVAILTAMFTTAFTAAVATASTPSPSPAALAHSVLKSTSKSKSKDKKKSKKKKPKPKPKTTTTTTRPTTTTTTVAPTPTTVEKPPSGNVTISEEGSTLLLPLFQQWASGYHASYSNVTINPSGGGSGKGISDAAAGVVDIGASDAYLSSSQVQATPDLENIALAISSQMIVTNLKGWSSSQHINLSGQVISQIYQGKITNWSDDAIKALNPGVTLPNEQIVALHRIDSSGDTFLFSQFLSDADPSGWGSSVSYGTTVNWPNIGNLLGENGNSGMVAGCDSTPGCIAYIGISYKSQVVSDGLQVNSVQNASGNFEQPIPSSITSEAHYLEPQTPASETLSLIYDGASDGYPIVNYEYAIVQKSQSNANEAAAMRAFLNWCVDPSNGSNNSYLSPVGFIPLTPTVQGLSVAQIAKIGS